jgi:hypothetical protein
MKDQPTGHRVQTSTEPRPDVVSRRTMLATLYALPAGAAFLTTCDASAPATTTAPAATTPAAASSATVAYFSLTGPTLMIEYSPQGNRGAATGSAYQVHGIYREPTNGYGAKYTL